MRTESRYSEVRSVLIRILFLNLAVAFAKIIFGQLSGSISILSDGFHSLTDGASNVVALVGLRLAEKPPDANHPYGHRKFETLAAGGIALFLLIIVVEVAQATFVRFSAGGAPSVSAASFAIMLATLAINVAVVRAERRAAKRLSSELLLADARHTQSDVLTSIAVIVALAGSAFGYPILDLSGWRRDLHWFLRQLEEVLIRGLDGVGIAAERDPGRTGVWTDGRKIASIGLHVKQWVTFHGFALNVTTDLSLFDLIVPCGLSGVTMTSVARERPALPNPWSMARDAVIASFGTVFEREIRAQPDRAAASSGSASRG